MFEIDVNKWMFNAIFCRNEGVLETGEKYSFNEDGSEMTIMDVTKLDEGEYTCIAKNKAGESEHELSLRVFGEPEYSIYCTHIYGVTINIILSVWDCAVRVCRWGKNNSIVMCLFSGGYNMRCCFSVGWSFPVKLKLKDLEN